jgi:hypothetical protein|tara:strand:+ start:940 stop:1656 length:717 start_codon:yes stop_codon:yes gene_type:complete
MRIACWSGPRNISTALMRSWSSREDTFVSDEPFYAYYLKEKQLKHPMYKEIIKCYPNEYDDVVKGLNSEIPKLKKIWYQKHMAHHLIDLNNIDWIQSFENCILIRHPKDVISSYIKKNTLRSVEDLGYPQQYKIIEYLKDKGIKPIIIDSDILLNNPQDILSKWCNHINIKFDISMLSWSLGSKSTDGIWWKHWYGNVVESTHFTNFGKKDIKIAQEYFPIYQKSFDIYQKMYSLAIK